jgi:Ca2+-binding RTX toxin-like protein
MTTNVTQATRNDEGWKLAIVNPDPVDGLAYLNYFANQPGGYNVNIATSNNGFNPWPYTEYFVFRIGDDTGTASDTIYTNNAGTYEAREGDDTFVNFATNNAIGGSSASRPVVFFGGNGDDQFNPSTDTDPDSTGATVVYGGSGNDTINGGFDEDILFGDTTNSFLNNPGFGPLLIDLAPYDTSRDGNDILNGYDGNDLLSGDGGNDQLFGGDGSDTLLGGDGSDFLYGGPRAAGFQDVLTGGNGADVFLLSYNQESSSSAFWSNFFLRLGLDVANASLRGAFQTGIKTASTPPSPTTQAAGIETGFLAASISVVVPEVGPLISLFVSVLGDLFASSTPANQDVMIVTDFDPREDVLQLPLQPEAFESLDVSVETNLQAPGLVPGAPTLVFKAGGVSYAYLQLSADFIADMNLAVSGNTEQVLKNIFNLTQSSFLVSTSGDVTFSNLSTNNPSTNTKGLLSELPKGGFQPVQAQLPSGSLVGMYGAIGGLVMTRLSSNGVLAGTNYNDVLSGNEIILDPSQLTTANLSGVGQTAYIFGFGGADLIYGTAGKDTLDGGDGDDVIWSFTSAPKGGGAQPENIAGGDGDDLLIGGTTAGSFDGGTGSDTFSVFYIKDEQGFSSPMQIEVDLVLGYAAERPLSDDFDLSAPVGPAPFPGTGQNAVTNSYILTSIENAIGGPLNDWIRAASGSTIEGAAGADFLLAEAVDGVTLSYQGSEDGVSVQIFEDGATSSGGDAEGDVISTSTPTGGAPFFSLPFQATNFDGLVGSAQSDTLGGYLSNFNDGGDIFTFTGNGGTDVFQITGAAPAAAGRGSVFITDFDGQGGSGDKIDLRPLGTTASDLDIIGPDAFARGANGQDIGIVTGGLDSPKLTQADFLLAKSVFGVGQARREGDGLSGGIGRDLIFGNHRQDFLFGNGANDLISGDAGNDVADGGAGNDRLSGGSGADRLRGGTGRDRLAGGSGDDLIDGGVDADTMRGGQGADTFLLRFGEINGDYIVDYNRSEGDRLTVVGSGPLSVVGRIGGIFAISDGMTTETVKVFGATPADFILA